MKCIDFYSGIGGWTLGMKLAGVHHLASYEWNPESNLTHNINFGTSTAEADIRALETRELAKPGTVDIVVGSPPCTQFSFANRGGKGNIEDGLVDLHKFLSIVEYLKPKYWAMENVPRVKGIINSLVVDHPDFRRFSDLISFNEVVNAADFGAPQNRKRMICGNFPSDLFLSYREKCPRYHVEDVTPQLEGRARNDVLFGWAKGPVLDHEKEVPLNDEEIRINREAKLYHPVYNRMAFPDEINRPSRTVTSLCTRVSRESIVIADGSNYRRLTLRERGVLMGFPVNFQFYGRSYSSKIKMIGNAIPPPLTYHIFNSMLGMEYTPLKNSGNYRHALPDTVPPVTHPPIPRNQFRPGRNFRFCVPSLRFGSGVRFELSNGDLEWRIRFYYGSSKRIHEVRLDSDFVMRLEKDIGKKNLSCDLRCLPKLNSEQLQMGWTGKGAVHPFEVLDFLGEVASTLEPRMSKLSLSLDRLERLLGETVNRSMAVNIAKVYTGLVLGARFNRDMEDRDK